MPPFVSTDEQLLDAWRGGDRRAGAALFERHYEPVARFFRNKVGDRDGADLIQKTFLALVESKERFRGHSSFRTFLFAVVRNVALRHEEKRARRKEQQHETGWGEQMPADDEALSQVFDRAWAQAVMRESVGRHAVAARREAGAFRTRFRILRLRHERARIRSRDRSPLKETPLYGSSPRRHP